MRFLVNMVASVILAPFKLISFLVVDVLIKGVLGALLSIIKTVLKVLVNPVTLILAATGVAAYLYASEEQKKKVKALMGM
jgi:hypothetical protein